MKKIFSIAFVGAALMSLVACSEAAYDDKYADPSKTSTVGVPQVFTAVLQKGNTWMNPVYYRYYSQSTTSGLYSGIIGNSNGKGRFQGAGERYFNDRWKNFFDMATQYRLLEKNYNELPEAQQVANKVFLELGRAVVEHQLFEMITLYGDVPFTQCGTLWMTGNYAEAKPAYDDDVTLAGFMIDDLKEIGDYLAGSVDATGLASLKRQDYTMAKGNEENYSTTRHKEMWQKFVNSLRLRVALQFASKGEVAAKATAAIGEILGNPSKYPLIDNNSENMGVTCDTSNDTFNFGKSLSQALAGRPEASASQNVFDVMRVGADGLPTANTDPRLQVMYDPNPDGEYIAYDVTKSSQDISNIADAKQKEYVGRGITGSNYYAVIDSTAVTGWAQYQGNANMHGLWLGAAEVALAKAEAYLMGYGVGKDEAKAKAAFVEGVKLSSEYYYNLKNSSSLSKGTGVDGYYEVTRMLEPKTEADFIAYAESIWAPTLECVASQQWLNHGFMNELMAWNTVRRTGYPTIKFAKDDLFQAYAVPAARIPYPSDELNYNTENCKEARTKNYGNDETGYYQPLFWAKDVYYTLVK